MTVISDVYLDVAMILSKCTTAANFCSIFKLTRVDLGNVSKKGKNMKGIIT